MESIKLNTYNDTIISDFEKDTLLNLYKSIIEHHRDELVNEDHSNGIKDDSLIYLALAGSQSFNLNIDNSDQDFIGIREAPIDSILSIDGTSDTVLHLKPDITIYELKHWAKSMLLGNPKMIEALYTQHNCFISDNWNKLRDIRKQMITIVSIDHYINTIKALHYDLHFMFKERNPNSNLNPTKVNKEEINNNNNNNSSNNSNNNEVNEKILKHQLKQKQKSLNNQKKLVENNKLQSVINQKKLEDSNLEIGNTFHKKAYHAIRLLGEVNRLVDGLDPIVRFHDDSEERSLLLSIRRLELTDEVIIQLVHEKFNEFLLKRKSLSIPHHILPEEVDIDLLNKWLVNIRRKSIDNDVSKRFNFPIESSNCNNSNSCNIESPVNNNTESYRIKKLADDLLKRHNVRGEIIYVGISGSHLVNLSDGDSSNDDNDRFKYDYIGIYAAATDDIVSLSPPPIKIQWDEDYVCPSLEWIPRNHNTQSMASPTAMPKKDIVTRGMILYEVGYAIHLLIHGNYRLAEVLFTDDRITQRYQTEAWLELLKHKSFFGNRTMAQTNWGVAQSEYMKARQLLGFKKIITNKNQLKKLNKENNNSNNNTIAIPDIKEEDLKKACKHLYFSYRLFWVSKQIIDFYTQVGNNYDGSGFTPKLYFENGSEERRLLLNLKHGRIDKESLCQHIEECGSLMEESLSLLEPIKKSFRSEDLEKEAKIILNPWLIKIRKSL